MLELRRWQLRSALTMIRIVPELSVQDGIQAVRQMLPRTWFDAEKCDEGLESLRQYQREWDEDKKTFREKPRHDWTSHSADAFRMLAVAWREEQQKTKEMPSKFDTDLTISEIIQRNARKRGETA